MKNLLYIFILLFVFSCGGEDKSKYQDLGFHKSSDLYTEQEEDFTLYDFKAKKVEFLVIHCTASAPGRDYSKKWFMDFFKNERKWDKPGYSRIIAPNGRVDTLVYFDNDGFVDYNEITNGVAGINSRCIHISYQGGIDKNGKPKDTRTPEQKAALIQNIKELKKKFPWIVVRSHFEFAPKACPSFNATKEYKNVK